MPRSSVATEIANLPKTRLSIEGMNIGCIPRLSMIRWNYANIHNKLRSPDRLPRPRVIVFLIGMPEEMTWKQSQHLHPSVKDLSSSPRSVFRARLPPELSREWPGNSILWAGSDFAPSEKSLSYASERCRLFAAGYEPHDQMFYATIRPDPIVASVSPLRIRR